MEVKREHFRRRIREHNEAEITKFFNNLKDFEIGERIRKTYKYLKSFSRNRKHKGPLIPMKHWVAILEESTGKQMNIPKDQETLTESPTRMEIEEIIKKSNGKWKSFRKGWTEK